MALSDSTDFAATRDDIITEALQINGVVEEGGTPSANKLSDCSRTLNMMVKTWQADGLQLWVQDEVVLFQEKDKQTYSMGPSGDRMVLAEDLVETDIDGDVSSGATSITVDSTTGMSASDNIGIVTDDGMFWTTISSVDSSTTLTLDSGVSNDVSDDASVYTYTNAFSERPLKIRQAFRRDSNDNDIPLVVSARHDYYNLSNKSENGIVNQIYFDPQLTNSELKVWPVAGQNELSTKIHLLIHRPFQDFDSGSNDPHFPQEWFLVLSWGLAYYTCDKYGIPETKRDRIERTLMLLKDKVLGWDAETNTSLFLSPDFRYMR